MVKLSLRRHFNRFCRKTRALTQRVWRYFWPSAKPGRPRALHPTGSTIRSQDQSLRESGIELLNLSPTQTALLCGPCPRVVYYVAGHSEIARLSTDFPALVNHENETLAYLGACARQTRGTYYARYQHKLPKHGLLSLLHECAYLVCLSPVKNGKHRVLFKGRIKYACNSVVAKRMGFDDSINRLPASPDICLLCTVEFCASQGFLSAMLPASVEASLPKPMVIGGNVVFTGQQAAAGRAAMKHIKNTPTVPPLPLARRLMWNFSGAPPAVQAARPPCKTRSPS